MWYHFIDDTEFVFRQQTTIHQSINHVTAGGR